MSAQYIIKKKNLIEKLLIYSKECQVYYPIKANSNSKVIRLIDQYVKGYEVDSVYHLHDLLFKYKVNPDRIIFSALVKSTEVISNVIKWGVKKFVVDNVLDLENIISLSQNSTLTFFIRVDVSEFVSADGLILKWGASINEVAALKSIIREKHHNFVGYSFYLPQEINSVNHIKQVICSLYDKVGFSDCKYLDIGGGIDSKDIIDIVNTIEEICGNTVPNIIVEPGRHLLGPCIDLCVTVLAIRFKQGKKLVFINSGIYDGLLDVKIKNKRFTILPHKKESDNTDEECIICGNSADISDNLGIYILPKDIEVGDKLLILNCGAYCSEMDTIFCKNKRANYKVDS